MSPRRVFSIMTSKTPPKPKAAAEVEIIELSPAADADNLLAPVSKPSRSRVSSRSGSRDTLDTVKTPEKENLPDMVSNLRKQNEINKTPRIRIKKITSSVNPSSSSDWKVKKTKT